MGSNKLIKCIICLKRWFISHTLCCGFIKVLYLCYWNFLPFHWVTITVFILWAKEQNQEKYVKFSNVLWWWDIQLLNLTADNWVVIDLRPSWGVDPGQQNFPFSNLCKEAWYTSRTPNIDEMFVNTSTITLSTDNHWKIPGNIRQLNCHGQLNPFHPIACCSHVCV